MDARISSMTHQGLRSYQEDRFVISHIREAGTSGTLLSVADGHGGDETSSYVERQLSGGLFGKMLHAGKDPNNTMKKTFQFLSEETLEQNGKSGAHYESGTTLSAVFVPEARKKAYIGIIGDSPVILAKSDGSIHVSPEHNARSNMEERRAAEERGGRYFGGYIYEKSGGNGLQLTRDIGYYAMGDVVARHPEIYDLALDEGDVIIVASDGLLDPGHSDSATDAKRLARLVLAGAGAQELVDDALSRETGDNVTAIVYRC